MGVDDFGTLKIRELCASFCYEGEGEIVWLDARLLHLAEEMKGFLTATTVDICSDVVVPCSNS